jgi:hypothetical protein
MATAAKKKKPAAKTKKKTTGSAMKKGSKLQCRVCGMSITVDEVCGCIEAHDIMCCGTEMKPKKK